MPPGPESVPTDAQLAQKVGKSGILALRDQFASLAQDKVKLRLGADARYSDAANPGQASNPTLLTSNAPSSSGNCLSWW